MVSFKELGEDHKKMLMGLWSNMSESDKTHFINQVAIALSVLGPESTGRKKIIDVIKFLLEDGAHTLADFGIYMRSGFKSLNTKERRAVKIVDHYRMKYNLPNMPSKPLF